MAVEKIIIASIKVSGAWFNVTDSNGREISVGTTDKSGAAINPKSKAILATALQGTEIELDTREWGKEGEAKRWFGNDPKAAGAAGAKTFAPKDWHREAAYYSAQAAGNILSLQKDVTKEKFEETAMYIQQWILKQTSK